MRIAAVKRISDQAQLARIARLPGHPKTRLAAIKRLHDQDALEKLVLLDPNGSITYAALVQLRSPESLARIVEKLPSGTLREIALRGVTDQEVLLRLALRDKSDRVRAFASQRLTDPRVMQRYVLTEDTRKHSIYLRCRAVVERMSDSGALTEISVRAERVRDAWPAVDRIVGPRHLLRVVETAKLQEVRKRAFARIEKDDLEALGRVAQDEGVHNAIRVRLGTRTWKGLAGDCRRDPSAIDALLVGTALVDGNDEIRASISTLCLTLIRGGDAANIPGLCQLLAAHGTKRLAESFLNCGQPDLETAGHKWGKDHGYHNLIRQMGVINTGAKWKSE